MSELLKHFKELEGKIKNQEQLNEMLSNSRRFEYKEGVTVNNYTGALKLKTKKEFLLLQNVIEKILLDRVSENQTILNQYSLIKKEQ